MFSLSLLFLLYLSHCFIIIAACVYFLHWNQHWQDLKFWYLQHLAQWLAHGKCWGNPCWLNKWMSSNGEENIPEQRWSPSSTCWWKCWQGTGREKGRHQRDITGKKFFPALFIFCFFFPSCYWNKNEEYIICEAVFSVYCHQVNNSNGARRKWGVM